MKKVLALLLSVAMLLPTLPMTAFAAPPESIIEPAIDSIELSKKLSGNTEPIEPGGEKKVFNIKGRGLNIGAHENWLAVKLTLNGEDIDVSNKYEFDSGVSTRASLRIQFPENLKTEEVKYTVSVTTDKKWDNPDKIKSVEVIQKAAKPVVQNSEVNNVTFVPKEIGHKGTRVSFNITGTELDKSGLDYYIEKAGSKLADQLIAFDKQPEGNIVVSFTIEDNNEQEDVEYKFYAKGKNQEGEHKSAGFTQRGLASYVQVKEITQQQDFKLPEEGGKVKFNVTLTKEFIKATDPKDQKDLKVEVKHGMNVITPLTEIRGEGTERSVSLTFGPNAMKQEQTYTLRFRTDTEDFLSSPVVTITQAALSEKTIFTDISTKNAFLPLKGGVQGITIKGANLVKENLTIEAYKVVEENLQPVTENEMLIGAFDGTDRLMTSRIEFKPVTEETTYKFVVKDKRDNNEKDIFINLSREGSDKELRNLEPMKLFFLTDTTIKMVINEPVKEARKDSIIKYARLIKGGRSYPLPKGTTVRIDESDIYIDMKKWEFDDYKNVRLHFPDRTIESLLRLPYQNLAFTYNVELAGIIESSEFVEGSVLEHTGGRVHLQIKGHNFNDKKVRAKVSKLEALKKLTNGSVGVTELENVDVLATDKQIDITFMAPANNSKHIESYIVLLSLDGIYYSGEYAQTINERAKRMVVSVKNEGLDTKEPVLGFARITSYETNPVVNGVPDSLHTITPVNQESKKTFVYLYGINLDENRTKIRAIDSRGVIFSPVAYSVADSTDRFLTVSWAYQGYGNNQFIELIAPRMYKADMVDGKPVDQKYKYQIAVDGKNFNDEIVVHATVKDDGESRLDKDELLCEVKLNFVDERGRVIHEPIMRKGYYILPPDAVSMRPIEIEGYKYSFNHSEYDIVEKSIAEFSPGVKETKKGEITYIYKSLKSEAIEPLTDSTSKTEEGKDNSYTDFDPDKTAHAEKIEKMEGDKKVPLGELQQQVSEVFDLPKEPVVKEVIFEDLKEGKGSEALVSLAKYGIIKGMSETRMEPERELSRAMFVEMLYRTVKDKSGDKLVLNDLNTMDWFFKSASWASAKGLVVGDAEGNFLGNKKLTGAEFAVILDRFVKRFNLPIVDMDMAVSVQAPKWAEEALVRMIKAGLVSPDTDAHAFVTREEAAKSIYILLKLNKAIQ